MGATHPSLSNNRRFGSDPRTLADATGRVRVPPALPAQVVVQQGRACATNAPNNVSAGEFCVEMRWLSHPKSPRGPPRHCTASILHSLPVSPRPREPGRQRAAGGPAGTIWRCGSARGSAGQGAQRGRPTARRTWGKTVRDKRRLSQVPAAQASAADECRCGGLGVGPLIIPRASHPPRAHVHWGGGLGGTVGYAAWSAWTASTGYLWATERDVGERTVCPAREM